MASKNSITWEDNPIVRRERCLGNERFFGEFNKVLLRGEIIEDLEYSHEIISGTFYKTVISVLRAGGGVDLIPIMVHYELFGELFNEPLKGKMVEVMGQYRSHNQEGVDGKSHLNLFVYAKNIKIYDDGELPEEQNATNIVYLEGHICRQPIFRKTPLGYCITDLMLSVDRDYDLCDYIPCIAWGGYAKFSGTFNVGDHVKMYARIQSRTYTKRNSPGSEEGEKRTAYEVSVLKIYRFLNDKVD